MHSVLIADDNNLWCYVLKNRLCSDDHFGPIYTAENGKTAIEMIDKFKPDIVIMDIIMPIHDGIFVIEYIRAHYFDYFPVTYIISGIATDSIVKIIHALNVHYYSIKPVAIDEVIKNLFRLIAEE